MITTPLDDLVHGIAETEQTPRGLALHRLPAWVRQQFKRYQIDADDVYAKIGGPAGSGHWDFQLGRFMSWRVIH